MECILYNALSFLQFWMKHSLQSRMLILTRRTSVAHICITGFQCVKLSHYFFLLLQRHAEHQREDYRWPMSAFRLTVSWIHRYWLSAFDCLVPCYCLDPWWRHQMKIFSAILAICAGIPRPLCGNSPVPGEFHAQRPVTRSFDVFFYLRLNKRLSKQSRGWWFETPSRSLWRHRNANAQLDSCELASVKFKAKLRNFALKVMYSKMLSARYQPWSLNMSTHSGLVTPYGDIYQYGLRYLLVA